jgi:hypothetical protein
MDRGIQVARITNLSEHMQLTRDMIPQMLVEIDIN